MWYLYVGLIFGLLVSIAVIPDKSLKTKLKLIWIICTILIWPLALVVAGFLIIPWILDHRKNK